VTLLCLIATTSSRSLPSTLVTDAPETITHVPTEAAVDSTSSEASSGPKISDNSATNAAEAVPGIQIETDVLLMIPGSVPEEGPLTPIETRLENRARALDEAEDYDSQEKHSVIYNDDMDAAEALVFRPLFHYGKSKNMRRRVDRNNGRHRKDGARRTEDAGSPKRFPFKYCPPCRFYFY
jgi:hypothetical protein